MNSIVEFDQILYMHWYWQDVDLDDYNIFHSFSTRVMTLDRCWNIVYAQYIVDQLMDFDKIL